MNCLFLFLALSLVGPDDPAKPEQLPPPREETAAAFIPAPELYYRRSRYDVWQFYGVNRQGQFRPRVVLSPYGSYYLYDGRSYPWVLTHQRDFDPFILD